MDTLAQFASSTYPQVVGFSAQQIVGWATTTIQIYTAFPFIFLAKLTPWLIATLMIGATLYFAAAAFHFFKH